MNDSVHRETSTEDIAFNMVHGNIGNDMLTRSPFA